MSLIENGRFTKQTCKELNVTIQVELVYSNS